MAEEHKPEHHPEHHKKRKPRTITTHRHDDDTFHHEHHFDGGTHAMYAGTSENLDDVDQHMRDHFGGAAPAEAEPTAVEPGATPEGE